ncbi:MAG: FAD:protein FMN transferase [Acidobacteria bacterium]|nr:FAD:protein FMN transferase [Acidobacteriota bacterium]
MAGHAGRRARRPASASGFLLLVLLTAATGCRPSDSTREFRFQGSSMGTTFEVKVVASPFPEQQQEAVREAIQLQLQDVDGKMSTYREASEISRLNRSRETTPHAVSRETFTVLAEAQRISRVTGGAFDITVGPLVNAWGFGPAPHPASPPAADEIEQLKLRSGWAKIELNSRDSTILKQEPALTLDLSAIAKGYAVDRLSDVLAEMNLTRHMVELGGEVRTSGRNAGGKPWRIAIEKPVSGGRVFQRILPLENLAVATSGDYRNFRQAEDGHLSHTIDPRTGRPVRHELASVSVVDASCMRADGYATALMVLGEDDGYRLALEQELAALFLVRTREGSFRERETPAFRRLFGTKPSGMAPDAERESGS